MHPTILALSLLPEGVDPMQFIILGSLSVMVMAAAKAGLGGGVGMLSVPLMTYACAPASRLAIGTMLPLLIACDYVTIILWSRRRAWDWRNVRLLLPGMLIGTAVGWAALRAFDALGASADKEISDTCVKLGIGVIALTFVALRLVRLRAPEGAPFRPTLRHGLATGSAAGFTSTLAHAAGPITTMYLLPQRMGKSRYVATGAMYYWIGNQVKLLPYFEREMITTESLLAGAALAPAIVVGAAVGFLLHKRINEKLFRAIIYILLGGVGVDLTVRSLHSLIKLLG